MSGHSKWKNIMHKKEKTDAQKAKVFTKIGKEMAIAIREGGADPVSNSKLRDLIQKAKANNVPNDNIDRIIKKFSGDNTVVYDEITYEGYGPSGVAVIVKAATDNRNRTAGEVRHAFDKYGAGLGQNGCVSYLFEEKGVIIIEKTDAIDEDALMEVALEAGMEDLIVGEEEFEIQTAPEDLNAVSEALRAAGYELLESDVDYVPTMESTPSESDIKSLVKMLEVLENDDDVQKVYHNCAVELDY